VPRRAAPGDAERIERALSPDLRDALETLRELLDLHDWRLSPLGPPFTAAAAVLMAIGLTRDGLAPSTALDTAAAHLGIERDTLRSWLRRWPAASRVQHAPARRGSKPVSLIVEAAEARNEERNE
jgi:hypothetical protein